MANRLAHRVLGRSLDELPPGTRRLLEALERLGDTQLKVHLARLVSLELVYAHRGAHGVFVYELAWDGEAAADGSLLPGLIDHDQSTDDGQRHGYDSDRSGPDGDRSGGGRPPVGARLGSGRPAENGQNVSNGRRSRLSNSDSAPSGLSRADARRCERTAKTIPGDRSDPLGFPVLVMEFLSRGGPRVVAEDDREPATTSCSA